MEIKNGFTIEIRLNSEEAEELRDAMAENSSVSHSIHYQVFDKLDDLLKEHGN